MAGAGDAVQHLVHLIDQTVASPLDGCASLQTYLRGDASAAAPIGAADEAHKLTEPLTRLVAAVVKAMQGHASTVPDALRPVMYVVTFLLRCHSLSDQAMLQLVRATCVLARQTRYSGILVLVLYAAGDIERCSVLQQCTDDLVAVARLGDGKTRESVHVYQAALLGALAHRVPGAMHAHAGYAYARVLKLTADLRPAVRAEALGQLVVLERHLPLPTAAGADLEAMITSREWSDAAASLVAKDIEDAGTASGSAEAEGDDQDDDTAPQRRHLHLRWLRAASALYRLLVPRMRIQVPRGASAQTQRRMREAACAAVTWLMKHVSTAAFAADEVSVRVLAWDEWRELIGAHAGSLLDPHRAAIRDASLVNTARLIQRPLMLLLQRESNDQVRRAAVATWRFTVSAFASKIDVMWAPLITEPIDAATGKTIAAVHEHVASEMLQQVAALPVPALLPHLSWLLAVQARAATPPQAQLWHVLAPHVLSAPAQLQRVCMQLRDSPAAAVHVWPVLARRITVPELVPRAVSQSGAAALLTAFFGVLPALAASPAAVSAWLDCVQRHLVSLQLHGDLHDTLPVILLQAVHSVSDEAVRAQAIALLVRLARFDRAKLPDSLASLLPSGSRAAEQGAAPVGVAAPSTPLKSMLRTSFIRSPVKGASPTKSPAKAPPSVRATPVKRSLPMQHARVRKHRRVVLAPMYSELDPPSVSASMADDDNGGNGVGIGDNDDNDDHVMVIPSDADDDNDVVNGVVAAAAAAAADDGGAVEEADGENRTPTSEPLQSLQQQLVQRLDQGPPLTKTQLLETQAWLNRVSTKVTQHLQRHLT